MVMKFLSLNQWYRLTNKQIKILVIKRSVLRRKKEKLIISDDMLQRSRTQVNEWTLKS